eukprot:764987-Hanusia_phi.AAC.3
MEPASCMPSDLPARGQGHNFVHIPHYVIYSSDDLVEISLKTLRLVVNKIPVITAFTNLCKHCIGFVDSYSSDISKHKHSLLRKTILPWPSTKNDGVCSSPISLESRSLCHLHAAIRQRRQDKGVLYIQLPDAFFALTKSQRPQRNLRPQT